jgi:hypothetical protein
MLSDKELLRSLNGQSSRRRRFSNQIAQISVTELETMAETMRAVGDEGGAEYLERQALALLDKKICRKIIRQGRRSQRRLGDLVMPLMEGIG